MFLEQLSLFRNKKSEEKHIPLNFKQNYINNLINLQREHGQYSTIYVTLYAVQYILLQYICDMVILAFDLSLMAAAMLGAQLAF